MLRKVAFIAIITMLAVCSAQSARNPKDSIKANTLFVGPFFGMGSASTLVDRSGTEISKMYDTVHSVPKDTIYEYGFDQRNYYFGLDAEYYLMPELSFSGGLTFIYHDYTESYSENTNAAKAGTERFHKSYTEPLSVDFGCQYRVLRSDYGDVYFQAGGRIDLLKKDSAYNPYIVHLRDMSQFWGGVRYDYLSQKYFLSGSVMYSGRDMEPRGQILLRAEAGLKSIKDTRMLVFFESTINTKGEVGKSDINPRFLPEDENHGNAGAEFSLIIGKNYYASLSYTTTFYGKNTISGGNGCLRFGVFF